MDGNVLSLMEIKLLYMLNIYINIQRCNNLLSRINFSSLSWFVRVFKQHRTILINPIVCSLV